MELVVYVKRSLRLEITFLLDATTQRSIWEMLLSLCGINRVIGNWSEELQWAVQNLKGRNLASTLLRVAWKAFIYQVWKERNGRLHGNAARTNLQVLEAIKDVTRIRLAEIKRDATTNLGLSNSWELFDVC